MSHVIALWQPIKRHDLRCHRFDDASSEVIATACSCAKSRAAEVCPSACTNKSRDSTSVFFNAEAAHSRFKKGSQENQKTHGTRSVGSLDKRDHIGVRPELSTATVSALPFVTNGKNSSSHEFRDQRKVRSDSQDRSPDPHFFDCPLNSDQLNQPSACSVDLSSIRPLTPPRRSRTWSQAVFSRAAARVKQASWMSKSGRVRCCRGSPSVVKESDHFGLSAVGSGELVASPLVLHAETRQFPTIVANQPVVASYFGINVSRPSNADAVSRAVSRRDSR
jgi:hypothetical protein